MKPGLGQKLKVGSEEGVIYCESEETGVLWLYKVNEEDQKEMADRDKIFLRQVFGGEVVLGEAKVQGAMKEVRMKVKVTEAEENKGLLKLGCCARGHCTNGRSQGAEGNCQLRVKQLSACAQ